MGKEGRDADFRLEFTRDKKRQKKKGGRKEKKCCSKLALKNRENETTAVDC